MGKIKNWKDETLTDEDIQDWLDYEKEIRSTLLRKASDFERKWYYDSFLIQAPTIILFFFCLFCSIFINDGFILWFFYAIYIAYGMYWMNVYGEYNKFLQLKRDGYLLNSNEKKLKEMKYLDNYKSLQREKGKKDYEVFWVNFLKSQSKENMMNFAKVMPDLYKFRKKEIENFEATKFDENGYLKYVWWTFERCVHKWKIEDEPDIIIDKDGKEVKMPSTKGKSRTVVREEKDWWD